MSTQRLAIIDLGTNSARLLVADVNDAGDWRQVTSGRVACRLGERLAETGSIDPEAENRALRALEDLVQRTRRAGATQLRIIATHALRSAANGADCARRLEEQIGAPITCLSGADEARLVFGIAHRYGAPRQAAGWAALDLGGGSLELARLNDACQQLVSMSLGAVVVAHRVPSNGPIGAAELTALRSHVRAVLEEQAADFEGAAPEVAAAGGTVLCSAFLAGASPPISGYSLPRAEVETQLLRLAKLHVEERARLVAIGDRADIIVPGLAVLCETVGFLGASQLLVLEHGVREGALLELARAFS